MRKFAKGCLITALIMIAAGFICVAAAAATGGLKQTAYLIRDGALSIDAGDFDSSFVALQYQERLGAKDGITASEIDNLDIDIDGGYLNLYISEDDTFHVNAAEGRYSKVKCYVAGKTLYISQNYTVKHIWRRRSPIDTQIELYVPKSCDLKMVDIDMGAGKMDMYDLTVNGNMDVDLGAGDMSIYSLTVSDEMDVDLGAGRIYGEGVSVSDMDMDVGAGEAEFYESSVKDAKFSVAMGRLEYGGTVTGDLDTDCSMGNIVLNLDGSMKDHNYSMECDMGSIELDGRSYSGIINDMEIDNSADSEFSIDCAMGTIEVYFEKD